MSRPLQPPKNPNLPRFALSAAKSATGNHPVKIGCDSCINARGRCDATGAAGCSRCASLGIQCSFTVETHHGAISIAPREDLTRELAAVKGQLEQVRATNQHRNIPNEIDGSNEPESGSQSSKHGISRSKAHQTASTVTGTSAISSRKSRRGVHSVSSRRGVSPASSASTAPSSIYENIDNEARGVSKYDIWSWRTRVADEPLFLDQGSVRSLSLDQIELSVRHLQAARPLRQIQEAMKKCYDTLELVIHSIKTVELGETLSTDSFVWQEERARLKLWERDWEAVISETWESYILHAEISARNSMLADIEDLAENLNDVHSIVVGDRLPFETTAEGRAAEEGGKVGSAPETPLSSDDESMDEIQERLQMTHRTISGLYRRNKLHRSKFQSLVPKEQSTERQSVGVSEQDASALQERDTIANKQQPIRNYSNDPKPAEFERAVMQRERGSGGSRAAAPTGHDADTVRFTGTRIPLRSSNQLEPSVSRSSTRLSPPPSFQSPGHLSKAEAPGRIPQPVEPVAYQSRDGDTIMVLTDPHSSVTTTYKHGPAENITDPDLLRSGVKAHRMLLGSADQEAETIFQSFRVRPKPRQFFTVGKVFHVLWVEPAGESRTIVTTIEAGTGLGKDGARVFSKVRLFVVVREGDNYCSALPITTYGGQGVSKAAVKKFEHAIIYTGKIAPKPLQAELPAFGERAMRIEAIRVDPDNPEDKLDPMNRLDFGKVHTIQHNIKVRSFGKVHPKSMAALLHQFRSVWAEGLESSSMPPRPVSASSSQEYGATGSR